jgi:thiamine transport system substrate-binding protein
MLIPIRPMTRVTSLLTAVLLLASACGSSDGPDASDSGGTSPTVRLLTYDSFALDDDAAEAFENATGARIEVLAAGDSAAMLAGALLSAGSPEADVIFGIDNTTVERAVDGGLLDAFSPAAAKELPAELAAPGGAGDRLTPVDTSEVCVNVDSDWFTQAGIDPPVDFGDLTSEDFRDLLVVENPVNSSPGLAFMLGSIEVSGEDGWLDYWQALKSNGVRVSPSWDDAYYNDYTVNGGDRPLVLSYASSPPAEVVFSEGALDEPASTVATGTCVTQIEYAGVLAGAENPELARDLVEFMLSDPWQEAVALSNFVYPVTDVDLPEEFRRWAPRPEEPVVLDAALVSLNLDDWLEQWRSVME